MDVQKTLQKKSQMSRNVAYKTATDTYCVCVRCWVNSWRVVGEGSSANNKFGSTEISPLRRQELWCTIWINDFSMNINIVSSDIWFL